MTETPPVNAEAKSVLMSAASQNLLSPRHVRIADRIRVALGNPTLRSACAVDNKALPCSALLVVVHAKTLVPHSGHVPLVLPFKL